MLANKLNMIVWLFYGFAVVALVTTGFFFVQAANDTAHFVSFGVFAFLAMLSIAVGNALRWWIAGCGKWTATPHAEDRIRRREPNGGSDEPKTAG